MPDGVAALTIQVAWSPSLSSSIAESLIFDVVTELACRFAAATMSDANVVANDPVPDPVTAPVSVIVWSPVLVPELVPRKLEPFVHVPVATARSPRPSVVRCEAASASSKSARPALVQLISWIVPAPAVLRPRITSLELVFWILLYVTAPPAMLVVPTIPVDSVVTKLPVPVPVTAPDKTMVWSPVLVPDDVPECVPLNVPS